MKKFPEFLREKWLESGLSQRQFAEKAGITQATLSGLVTGKQRPHPTTLQGIAGAIGADFESLMREYQTYGGTRAPPNPAAPKEKSMTTDEVAAWFRKLPLKERRAVYAHLGAYLPDQNLPQTQPSRTLSRAG